MKKYNFIVSLVIPVYNTSLSLFLNLLKSLKLYATDKCEIIFIDDNSDSQNTNGYLNLIKEQNISNYIYKKNVKNYGPLKCRVEGAMISHSNYIYFFDSDDKLCRSLSNLINFLESTNFDVVLVDYLKNDELVSFKKESGPINFLEFLDNLVVTGQLGFSCCKLFKRSLFEKIDKTINYDLRFTEDLYLSMILCDNCSVYYYKECVYSYYLNSNSLTGFWSENKIKSFLFVIEKRFEFVKKNCLNISKFGNYCCLAYIHILFSFLLKNKKVLFRYKKNIKNCLTYKTFFKIKVLEHKKFRLILKIMLLKIIF